MLKGLITDIDGTITDRHRRIHTGAIELIRDLADLGIEIVLASGNTACFMDALCKMVGTRGSFIAENGGVYRVGFLGSLRVLGDQAVCRNALDRLQIFYRNKGVELEMYSPTYRFADLAFARTVPVWEVREVVAGLPVAVLDTGFAIHIQSRGITKGVAFSRITEEMQISPKDFLAAGDAQNDVELLSLAGIGVTVANAHPDAAAAAAYISEKKYGDGFIDAVERYRAYFLER